MVVGHCQVPKSGLSSGSRYVRMGHDITLEETFSDVQNQDGSRAEVFRLALDAKRRVTLTTDASVRAVHENIDIDTVHV